MAIMSRAYEVIDNELKSWPIYSIRCVKINAPAHVFKNNIKSLKNPTKNDHGSHDLMNYIDKISLFSL